MREREREREKAREGGRGGPDGRREEGRDREGEDGEVVGGREGEYLQGVWSPPKSRREWTRMKGIPPSSTSIIRCSWFMGLGFKV